MSFDPNNYGASAGKNYAIEDLFAPPDSEAPKLQAGVDIVLDQAYNNQFVAINADVNYQPTPEMDADLPSSVVEEEAPIETKSKPKAVAKKRSPAKKPVNGDGTPKVKSPRKRASKKVQAIEAVVSEGETPDNPDSKPANASLKKRTPAKKAIKKAEQIVDDKDDENMEEDAESAEVPADQENDSGVADVSTTPKPVEVSSETTTPKQAANKKVARSKTTTTPASKKRIATAASTEETPTKKVKRTPAKVKVIAEKTVVPINHDSAPDEASGDLPELSAPDALMLSLKAAGNTWPMITTAYLRAGGVAGGADGGRDFVRKRWAKMMIDRAVFTAEEVDFIKEANERIHAEIAKKIKEKFVKITAELNASIQGQKAKFLTSQVQKKLEALTESADAMPKKGKDTKTKAPKKAVNMEENGDETEVAIGAPTETPIGFGVLLEGISIHAREAEIEDGVRAAQSTEHSDEGSTVDLGTEDQDVED